MRTLPRAADGGPLQHRPPADALWEYRNIKDYLGEELGVFPGRPLQQLELAILRGEELTPRPWAESRIPIGEVL